MFMKLNDFPKGSYSSSGVHRNRVLASPQHPSLEEIMMLEILIVLGWLGTTQGINALFVLACVAGALGANGRGIMALSAVLYLALVVM
jgi:hypothetical protein